MNLFTFVFNIVHTVQYGRLASVERRTTPTNPGTNFTCFNRPNAVEAPLSRYDAKFTVLPVGHAVLHWQQCRGVSLIFDDWQCLNED